MRTTSEFLLSGIFRKGPCDGIGGTIKRLAARASLQGTLISTPRYFYEWAISNVRGIEIQYTSNDEHEEETKYLNSERYIGLRTVSGKRSIHCVVPVNDKLSVKTYSTSTEVPKEVLMKRVTHAERERGGASSAAQQ